MSRFLTLVVVLIVTTVSAWITAIRMRRRIRRSLGKDVTEAELTSLTTWMNVQEAEERNRGGKIT